MTHQQALGRMIEKLEQRLERAEAAVAAADGTAIAPYERGRRSAVAHALDDARILLSLADAELEAIDSGGPVAA